MTDLTEEQKRILKDIYEKSNQGANAVSIGENGIFIANNEQKAAYANDVELLKDMGYIEGTIGKKPKMTGGYFYIFSGIKPTPQGITICKQLLSSQ